jgi:hypothetical protein
MSKDATETQRIQKQIDEILYGDNAPVVAAVRVKTDFQNKDGQPIGEAYCVDWAGPVNPDDGTEVCLTYKDGKWHETTRHTPTRTYLYLEADK